MKHTGLMRIWFKDKNAITHNWSITASNNNGLIKKNVCFHAWQKVISTKHYNNACVHVSMDVGYTITDLEMQVLQLNKMCMLKNKNELNWCTCLRTKWTTGYRYLLSRIALNVFQNEQYSLTLSNGLT